VAVGHIARWLRDEEAAGSNPATPTEVIGHLRSSRVAVFVRWVTNQPFAPFAWLDRIRSFGRSWTGGANR
jgi:hypothetical protein